ncbi:MAG TPA: c-type cytochrome [Usitatibacter sp.]|nr:c-type cytochrome [Usitatibacter sp.]
MSTRWPLHLAIASLSLAAGLPAAGAGDAARGKDLYETDCTVCHSVDRNKVGPAHKGVFGRKAGSAPGYSYSAAVASSGVVWNEETLARWLTDPEKFIPGQKMGVSVPDAKEREDLVAYLKTLR